MKITMLKFWFPFQNILLDLLGGSEEPSIPNVLNTSVIDNNNSSSKANNQDLLDLLGGLDMSAPPTSTIMPPQQPSAMTSPLDSLVSGFGELSSTNDSNNIDGPQLLVNNLLGQQNDVISQPSSASVSNDILDDFTNFNQEVSLLKFFFYR